MRECARLTWRAVLLRAGAAVPTAGANAIRLGATTRGAAVLLARRLAAAAAEPAAQAVARVAMLPTAPSHQRARWSGGLRGGGRAQREGECARRGARPLPQPMHSTDPGRFAAWRRQRRPPAAPPLPRPPRRGRPLPPTPPASSSGTRPASVCAAPRSCPRACAAPRPRRCRACSRPAGGRTGGTWWAGWWWGLEGRAGGGGRGSGGARPL